MEKQKERKKRRNVTILEHELVPVHEKISDEELKELLNVYKIRKEQLPKIKSTDPVIKEIKVEEGGVVKIMRRSRTAGRAVSYRLVVK
ncbi:MAG: DNA-directed RNA polymerase subunit H [Halobacteriota archaeon]